MLGLGSNMMKHPVTGKSIVRDGLVLQHNYNLSSVELLSSGAASFNGTSDYIAINAKPVDTADATYCFWARADETGENRAIFAHGDGATGEFSINHASSGKPLLYLNSDLYQYWADTGFADDGKWHHWALVVDIDDMTACKLYCDGVEIAQDVRTTSGTATSYGNLEIGRSSTSHEFEGYMCNFGVWSSHLSQPQIKSIMNKNYDSLSASEKTDLVSWWNLDSVIPETTTLVYDNHHGGGEVLGAEEVEDGNFPSGTTDWSEGTGWSLVDGYANASSASGELSQSGIDFDTSKTYYIEYTISGYSGSGGVQARFKGLAWNTGVLREENGTFTEILTCTAENTVFTFVTSSSFTGSISNVSVKLINGNTGTLS
jgi:hypothetical protein